MQLWYCKTEYEPGSVRESSELVRALLRHAYERSYASAMPDMEKLPSGKPYFPSRPDRHFSISHSGVHLLCALSEVPVGCDIQQRRTLQPGTIERLMNERERRDFDFFDLWALRESFLKMSGEGSLRRDRFSREGGGIVSPMEQARCRLYTDIPGCACAVCLLGAEPEGNMRIVPFMELRTDKPVLDTFGSE